MKDLDAGLSRILVPLDGSAEAETVIPHTLRVGRNAEIVLLRVLEQPGVAISEGGRRVTAEDIERPRIEAEAYLSRLAADLEARGVRATTAIRFGPHPASEIAQAASELHADVIAMAGRTRTGLRRLFGTSVTDEVVHRAPVPVFLVPAERRVGGRAA